VRVFAKHRYARDTQGVTGAKQSSGKGQRNVSAARGTGLLRAADILRIAGFPALRNDEYFRLAV
jgi:hypothetical protein